MSRKSFLTLEQRTELLLELRFERSRKYADRIRIILLLDDGKLYKDICVYFFIDEGSVANYRKRYIEGGIDALINDNYTGRVGYLTIDQEAILERELLSRIYLNTKQIIIKIQELFGITYSRSGVTELLHKLKFSFKKAKGVPSKANKEDQENFKKELSQIKDKGPIYFADSTHPTLCPILSYGWIKTGVDEFIPTNSGKQRINITGAVNMSNLKVIHQMTDTVNSDSMIDFLKILRQKHGNNEEVITLILDNATYNKTIALREFSKKLKIKLFYLPPYSPNLNPIERLWKFFKKKILYNKFFENIDSFKIEISSFFKNIKGYRKELSQLINYNFQTF